MGLVPLCSFLPWGGEEVPTQQSVWEIQLQPRVAKTRVCGSAALEKGSGYCLAQRAGNMLLSEAEPTMTYRCAAWASPAVGHGRVRLPSVPLHLLLFLVHLVSAPQPLLPGSCLQAVLCHPLWKA